MIHQKEFQMLSYNITQINGYIFQMLYNITLN